MKQLPRKLQALPRALRAIIAVAAAVAGVGARSGAESVTNEAKVVLEKLVRANLAPANPGQASL